MAGALSLEDAARVVALRSRAIRALSGAGGMVSVSLPEEQVLPLLGMGVSVAAVNGPSSTVVSGDVAELDVLVARCEAEGVRARRVPVDYASHSAHVEAIESELAEVLAGIEPREAEIPLHSTVEGEPVGAALMDAGYWYRNLRRTVRFEQGIRAALADGHRVFVEVSPHPVLTVGMQETFDAVGVEAVAVGTLKRDEGGLDRVLQSAGELFCHGVDVDWRTVFADTGARVVDLPTYPFEHTRYWPDPAPPTAALDPLDAVLWESIDSGDVAAVADALAVRPDDGLSAVLPALSSWRKRRAELAEVDGLRYRVAWHPLPAADVPTPSGTWLVVGGGDRAGGIAGDLAARGFDVRRIEVFDDPARLVEDLAAVEVPVTGVLSLLALEDDADAVTAGAARTVTLLRALGDAGVGAPLWCATRGAVSTQPADPVTAPAQALLWGVGRVAALEHPDRWGGLVDLPERFTPRVVDGVLRAIAGATGEDQVAVRDTGVLVRRLVRATRPAGRTASWRPRGAVLITGGTGALGGLVARWVLDRGAEHVVLLSRGGPDAPGARALTEELGTAVTVLACDVTDAAALGTAVAAATGAVGPIRAVVHAAGAVHFGALADTTAAGFADAVATKVVGALNLDAVLAGTPLDAFVLFSSIAGVWGSGGQAAYSAANAFLDALAQRRRAGGEPATAVAWGSWGVGMLDDERRGQLDRGGVRAMAADTALTALDQAVADGEAAVVVADVDWSRFAPTFTLQRASRLFDALPEAADAADVRSGPDDDGALTRTLARLSPAERETAVLDLVRTGAAAVLGHAGPDAVDPDRAFQDIGFDSLTAVELRNRLRAATGLALAAGVVFDHPTPRALARHLGAGLVPDDAPVDRALAGIDLLETAAATAADAFERDRVVGHVRALLDRIGGERVEDDTADLIEAASDDDLFAFINTELGRSDQ
nr:SDR family NAD(P)-dependent oxidoreductase [Saccharothrix syringae]